MKKAVRKINEVKASESEYFFWNYCDQKKLNCFKLEGKAGEHFRHRFLENPNGKVPDFYCHTKGKEIFVEVKTLTNFTNKAREKKMGTVSVSEIFDPSEERKGPITKMARDTNKKFKNIKDEFKGPGLVFISGIQGDPAFDLHKLFLGAYLSYSKKEDELVSCGYLKKERGIFDRTATSVSAIIYWSVGNNCIEGFENPRAKIPFTKEDFLLFFKK
jgi:hypothetical protein